MSNKYIEYFKIDEEFYKCVDQEAIRKTPGLWKKTFPHPTFIQLLKNLNKMLGGNKQPIWIHGAYGTGKSQCAWAIKKILEVSETELREYWEKFDVLKTNANKDLLENLLGHKSRGIVTAYRFASGGINGNRDLLLAVQESVKKALIEAKVLDMGENTLKDSVIAWLSDPINEEIFNKFLDLPEFSSRFSQSSAAEVVADLKQSSEVKELMDNIFFLSDKRGITAFELNTDRLIEWIKDVINKNNIKIVLVWDEFSSFFANNRNSLDEFQKLASLAQSTPFYFIVVTHQTGHIMGNTQDPAWKVVQQRYEFSEITLPDSIAFDLIGSALDIDNNAREEWLRISDYLYAEVIESSKAVVSQIKKIETNSHISIEVFKKIMPIHPFAAMVLKYISTAFEANQRTMFDFIKSSDTEDVKAFQWFITETAQDDERPLLTVDLLWDFFYEKGRHKLTADIQAILDTFSHQNNLSAKEQAVLKTILIIQAIDKRTGNTIELFRLIDKNLSLAFEGVSELSGGAAISIAKKLVNDGILIRRKIANNVEIYNAVTLAGDQQKIDYYKEELRQKKTTEVLVAEGGLQYVIPLTSALKLRFDINYPNTKHNELGMLKAVTIDNFKRTLTKSSGNQYSWRFKAMICFAKDDTEVTEFRKNIKAAAANEEYSDIIFIDALSTPLGADAFEQYLDFQSLSMTYSANDNDLSRKYAKDAKEILDDNGWLNRVQNGTFIIYTAANPNGERYLNKQGVIGALESIVRTKFPYIMDFNKGLTEAMLYPGTKDSVKHGICQTSANKVKNIEKFTLSSGDTTVWKIPQYWEQPKLSDLPISKIKIALDKMIDKAFKSGSRQISIRSICDKLEDDYGFSPSNLTAFLTGFLLKEYCTDSYRFIDSTGKPLDDYSSDKPFERESNENILAAMISDYISNSDLTKYKDTYIARMTPDEKAFYDLSEKAFGILPNTCVTVGTAVIHIGNKIQGLGLPIWALQTIDDKGVYDVVEKFISLIQKEGADAKVIAIEIGKLARANPALGEDLHSFITKDNCQKGIREFLKTFEDGKILELAQSINANTNLIDDIRRLFNVERSHLWKRETGENLLHNLLIEYSIANETNILLSTNASSIKSAFVAWRDKLRYVHISAETAKAKFSDIADIIDLLISIYAQTGLILDKLNDFLIGLQTKSSHLSDFFANEKIHFASIYEYYLDGLAADDISKITAALPHGMFAMSSTECNMKVRDKAEEYRKGQLKVKLLTFWKERTGTKNPKEWSTKYKCPILAMVAPKNYDAAKKAFETINQNTPTEFAIKEALSFLENLSLFDDLKSEEKRDKAFIKYVIGEYFEMLTIQKVKDRLDRLVVDAYDWLFHPQVKDTIRKLAEAEYNAGGSDRALAILGKMTTSERDEYIKRLIKENIAVGLEIITRGEK